MNSHRVNPVVLFGLALLGICLLYLSVGNVTKVSDKLNDSSVFRAIIQCTDIEDGVDCFKQNRMALIKELRMKTVIGQQQWENCLDIIGDNSDINILLNIQKCYHQSDLLDNYNQGDTRMLIIAITMSLLIQVFIAFHLILNYVIKNSDLDDKKIQVNRLESGVTNLKTDLQGLETQHKDLVATQNSDIKNILGRLSRGGDIRRELEFIKRCFMQLNNELNQFKIEYFAKNNNDFLILPPTNSLRSPLEETSFNLGVHSSKLKNSDLTSKKNTLYLTAHLPSFSQDNLVSNNNSNINHDCDKENENNSNKGFDILSAEGRNQLKRYVQSRLRYRDLVKESNGKVLKRIFLPGRGWISAKKLEEEEHEFGSDGFIVGL